MEATNHPQQATGIHAKQSIGKLVKQLEAQIANMDQRIASLIESEEEWRIKSALLQTVPGVGKTVASTLVAEFPELGKVNRQEADARLAVAPYARESGKWTGKRSCKGERSQIWNVLYMAALSAKRYNPAIKALADRLEEVGKPFKVNMVARIAETHRDSECNPYYRKRMESKKHPNGLTINTSATGLYGEPNLLDDSNPI